MNRWVIGSVWAIGAAFATPAMAMDDIGAEYCVFRDLYYWNWDIAANRFTVVVVQNGCSDAGDGGGYTPTGRPWETGVPHEYDWCHYERVNGEWVRTCFEGEEWRESPCLGAVCPGDPLAPLADGWQTGSWTVPEPPFLGQLDELAVEEVEKFGTDWSVWASVNKQVDPAAFDPKGTYDVITMVAPEPKE